MPGDSATQITRQSWFGRVWDSIKGVVVGVVLLIGSFYLLFWNEGRAVSTAKGLAEVATSVISISPNKIQTGTEGKLIHITGKATTEEKLVDPDFGIAANAIKLQRRVETYQWVQSPVQKTRNKAGGGSETTTDYEYSNDWRSELIDSKKFFQPEGHLNPTEKKYPDWIDRAKSVRVGAYRLSEGLIDLYSRLVPVPLREEHLAKVSTKIRSRLKVADDAFFDGSDPAQPEVGDTRVRFTVVLPDEVSVIAQQQGDTFGPYLTPAGTTIERLEIGKKSAEEMFRDAVTTNTSVTWLWRLIGFVLMFAGLMIVVRPLVAMVMVVPFLGDMLGAGVGVFSFILATALSLGTIAVGWFSYSPFLASLLLIPVAGLIVYLKKFGHKCLARKKA